jgi:response regulator of citrate/malate metabolism
MDNQHKKIKGYRDLSQSEIDAMNQIKEKAAEVGELFKDLENRPELDKRWLAIAKTDLQKGFMAATRSVAKPDFF